MTKKIPALVLSVLVFVMSAFSVSAATPTTYVVDELGYLYLDEVEALSAEAAALHEKCGVGVFYVYTMSETLADYDVDLIVEGTTDYVVMMENETSWYLHLGGRAEEVVTEDMQQTLRNAYDEEMTYRSGVSAFLSETAALFTPVQTEPTAVTDGAATEIPSGADTRRLYDGAGLLSEAEKAELESKLNEVSKTYRVDVAIVTLDGIGGESIDRYIEQYFDSSDLGYGEQRDAVLLMLDMDSRQFRILSNGADLGAAAISPDDIEDITDTITSDLKEGHYATAFTDFVEECAYQIDGQINGFPFDYTKNILISVGVGLVVGFLITNALKSQLKSVKSQSAAANYVKAGSLALTASRDTFLYSNVTYTEKASKDTNSSSGSSRNVGGGSF